MDPENGETFCQRYWVSLEHFDGANEAPVYLLDGGETSGANVSPHLGFVVLRADGVCSVYRSWRKESSTSSPTLQTASP